ncbi:MAG: DUF1501 domain-containing protein [Bryobacterales bacterium]|nr:DUF1501 domain-containing protein [Bryobacterales bacterium]
MISQVILCPALDRTLTALVDDLEERGLLESALVLARSESGRTPLLIRTWGFR